MIDAGEVASLAALARQMNIDRSYASRILRMNLLAPDIVKAILAGNEPSGLLLARLIKNLPMLWTEQREQLGFPSE